MALYDYRCTKCEHVMEDVYQSIKDKPLKKCPHCKKMGLERIISGGILASVKEVKTIGSLIDKNTKVNKNKLKEEQCQRNEAANKGKKTPWHQQHRTLPDHAVKRMGKRRLRKYVMEGK